MENSSYYSTTTGIRTSDLPHSKKVSHSYQQGHRLYPAGIYDAKRAIFVKSRETFISSRYVKVVLISPSISRDFHLIKVCEGDPHQSKHLERISSDQGMWRWSSLVRASEIWLSLQHAGGTRVHEHSFSLVVISNIVTPTWYFSLSFSLPRWRILQIDSSEPIIVISGTIPSDCPSPLLG